METFRSYHEWIKEHIRSLEDNIRKIEELQRLTARVEQLVADSEGSET